MREINIIHCLWRFAIYFYTLFLYDNVIEWKLIPRYWPFVRGTLRSLVNSSHKGHWSGALMFFLSAPWMNGWLNNCEVGDLRCHRAYYDIIEMCNGHQSIHEFMSVIKCLIVRKLFEFSTLSFDIVMCSPTHYHTMELTQFMLNEINYLIPTV